MNQVNGRLLINIIDMNGGTLDPDCAIYRIIPRCSLIEILEKKQLTLTHPSMWDDPFETDQFALDSVMEAIDSDGIGTLIGDPSSEL